MTRGTAKAGIGKSNIPGSMLLATTVLAMALLAGVTSARASQSMQIAQAATVRHSFHIAAQPLSNALTAFGQQSGMQVSVDAALIRGVSTPGVMGTMTPEQALGRLLSGTGFTYHIAAGNTITLQKLALSANSAITLPPVQVEGRTIADNPYGPGVGYVGHRSVAATKTDTPLIETPQSVSVIQHEQLRDQAVRTVSEALRYTPGVVPEEYGGTDLRVDQYMVRGFASNNPYLDGLTTAGRYTLLAPKIDPYELDRVEVLRGPSSVLYGQNIPGGLVSLISKRPPETPLHEIELQGADPRGLQGAFDFGGPLNKDGTLLYRVTGLARGGETQVDHVDTHHYFLAPAFTYKPSSDTTFTVLAKLQHSNDGMLTQNLPAQGTLDAAAFGRIPTHLFIGEPNFNKVERNSSSIGYSFEHHLNDAWTVRQNLRYAYTDTTVNMIGTAGFQPGTTLLNRFSLGADAHVADFAVDTQAQVKFEALGLQHTALFGIDYFRSHDKWVEQDGSAAPLDVLNPVYGQPVTLPPVDFATDDTLSQAGLYAQDQIKWDRWVLTAGLRHDWADTSTTDLLANSTLSQDDQAFSGRAGLVYLFDNGLAPYVSYSTSFQPVIGTTFDHTPFKPTTGEQYEAGIKYQPAGSNSFVTLSAFTIDQNNVLTADSDPAHPFAQVQTGAQRVRGFEASGVADLGDGLKLIGAYTYTDGRITQDNSGNVGNIPKDIPRHMASLWADKTIQGGPLRGLGLGAGARYIGDRYGDAGNTLRIPGNFFVDASIHYEYENWRFAINAKNLLDKTYVATCDNPNFCYYGLRRTVIGTVSYHW